MILRLKVEFARLSEVTERLIVFFAAGEQVGIRQVRKSEQEGGQLSLHFLQLVVICLRAVAEFLHFGKNCGGILPFLLILRDQLGRFVLFCFERLGFGNQRAALAVKTQDVLHILFCVLPLCRKTGNHLVRAFLDIFNVNHCISFPDRPFSAPFIHSSSPASSSGLKKSFPQIVRRSASRSSSSV